MDVNAWKWRNNFHRVSNRLRHPWPLYRKVGGINAVVNRADGTTEDLGRISVTYAKRWGVGTK